MQYGLFMLVARNVIQGQPMKIIKNNILKKCLKKSD